MLKKVIVHLEDIIARGHTDESQVKEGIFAMINSLIADNKKIIVITERDKEKAFEVLKNMMILEYVENVYSKKDTQDDHSVHLLEVLNRQNIFLSIIEDTKTKAEDYIAIVAREEDVRAAKMANIPSIGYIDKRHAGFSESQVLTEGFEEIDSTYINRVYQRAHKIPWKITETKRCLLREMTVEDLDSLYDIYSNPQITKHMEPLFENKQDEIEYQRAYIERVYEFYEYGMWAVIDKETGKLIGRAGISNRELKGYIELELGYVIAVPYQRQGYGFEVCKEIIKYTKEKFGFDTINCFIQKDNTASIRLAEKLGFCWKEEVFFGDEILQQYVLRLK